MADRRALVLFHESDGDGCLVSERLRARGVEVVEHLVCPDYDAPDVARPFPGLDGIDLLVVMGSVRSLTAKAEIDSWIHEELDIVRSTHRRGLPILGVCFGGQLLAEALGGSVETAPVTEIGWFEIDGDANPVGPGPWMEWHHDRFHPPAEAEVLARNDNCVQLIRLGRSVGTQFHPEIDLARIEKWLELIDDEYLADHGVTRQQLLEDTRLHDEANRAQCFALVDWFLDEVAELS